MSGHGSWTCAHRGWNGQPGGMKPDGGAPAIVANGDLGGASAPPRTVSRSACGVGVRRVREHLVRRPLLDDPAAVHHADGVGDLGDHAHVVGDPQDRDAVLGLERRCERQDLGLYGHVERGRRLVGDEEARAQGERHRDHHALPHAAGELVRVHAGDLARPLDPDLSEELGRLPAGFAALHAVARLEDLRHLKPGRQHRVERRHRVLGEIPDQPPASPAELGAGEGRDVDAVDPHRTPCDLAARWEQAGDGQRERCLAGPRLAHDRHRPALLQHERRLGHGLERAVVHGHPVDLEERRHPASSTRARGSTSARTTSATRLKATTTTAAMMTVPMRSGRSSWL